MSPKSPLLLCLAVALFSAISAEQMWTKLSLSLNWPITFCSINPCHPNISYWTLHGLWPDKGNDCNSSWHFNASKIQDLLPDMENSWPDLLKPSSVSFWKYEWHKHGTCAARAASLNSQHKYFSKALELYHQVDLSSILKKFNIIPSSQYYKLSEIEGVMENVYGIKPKIQCAHSSEKPDTQLLGQIEICFDSDFSLLDCEKQRPTKMKPESKEGWDQPFGVKHPSEFQVCDRDVPVYYPPLS